MENIFLPHDKAEAIDPTSFKIPTNICLTLILPVFLCLHCQNLMAQGSKSTMDLADDPEEKSVRDGKKGEDISVTVQTEQEANFDVTKVGFGSFSWD